MTPEELLTTTRALQAPSSLNQQDWRWIVLTEPEQRARIVELHARGAHSRAGHCVHSGAPGP